MKKSISVKLHIFLFFLNSCAYADGSVTAEQMILSAYARGVGKIRRPLILLLFCSSQNAVIFSSFHNFRLIRNSEL